MSAGRVDEAIRYWELVWTMDPGHEVAVGQLKAEYLQRGIASFSDGDLDKAVKMWENVLRVDPGDERAAGYIRRAREQRARTRQILGN